MKKTALEFRPSFRVGFLVEMHIGRKSLEKGSEDALALGDDTRETLENAREWLAIGSKGGRG